LGKGIHTKDYGGNPLDYMDNEVLHDRIILIPLVFSFSGGKEKKS